MRPCTFRPAFCGSGANRDFSGVERVTVAKSLTDPPRRAGVVGLYLRIAMMVPRGSRRAELQLSEPGLQPGVEQLDLVAFCHRDDGALGVGTLPDDQAAALALARPVHRVDAQHLHLEDALDRLLDLGLVRPRIHDEGVLVLVEEAVGLLGDHGAVDDVAGVLHADATSSGVEVSTSPRRRPVPISARASSSKTTTSLTTTSWVLSWSTTRVWTSGRLRKERIVASSRSASTTSTLPSSSRADRAATASLVRATSKERSRTTVTSWCSARSDSAERSAARLTFLLTRTDQSLGTRPWATPPPTHCGARIEPCRARPVPFWRHGLRPPPRTSARVLVLCVPWRAAASCAVTTWCITGTLTGPANHAAGSSTEPTEAPVMSRTSTLMGVIVSSLAIRPHHPCASP